MFAKGWAVGAHAPIQSLPVARYIPKDEEHLQTRTKAFGEARKSFGSVIMPQAYGPPFKSAGLAHP